MEDTTLIGPKINKKSEELIYKPDFPLKKIALNK